LRKIKTKSTYRLGDNNYQAWSFAKIRFE